MSLVFGAITPHPPILIPAIGKENLAQIKKTAAAMAKLEEILFEKKPEVIIVISPHGNIHPESFSINLHQEYVSNLGEFGDLATKLKFQSDLVLANQIKKDFDEKGIPITLNSEEKLDHGAIVPLFYLTKRLGDIPIIPIGYSLLDLKAQFNFGEALKDSILNTDKRVAIVASGDLSHRLTPDAPAGYSDKGAEFDKRLIQLIENKNTVGILKLDPSLIEEAGECGLRSILILLGVMSRLEYTPEILSYEGPFGVGYLVANLKLK